MTVSFDLRKLSQRLEDSSWVVCQIGAREHYAIPRALEHSGQDILVYTDFWAGKETFLPIPEKLCQRFCQEVNDEHVVSWNMSFLFLELSFRFLGKKRWAATIERNKWFAMKVSQHLEKALARTSSPPVVFAYSYAAREIFTVARSFGCPTVLGQIDPGPVEMRLVERLYQEAGVPFDDQPPEEYWNSWRVECDLADIVMVNSKWSFSALEQEGVPAYKMVEVPLAYERQGEVPGVSLLPDVFSIERPLRILFLGQINLRKGILELAQAIELMEGLPVVWTIVGDGEEWLVEKLNKLPQTTVTGGVSRGGVGRYYTSSDVFILPTHSDGYALTQLEAASYGLPIIASRFCGEVVAHGENGLVLEDVTAVAIVKAVSQLLDVPGKLAALQKNMLEYENYTIQHLACDLGLIKNTIGSFRNCDSGPFR